MQKQLIHNLIKPQDIYQDDKEPAFTDLFARYINLSSKGYEIKSRLDSDNIEIIYTRRYFLPVVFKRFYTIQIERYTKSIQQQFDELQKQNLFFNKNIDMMFNNAQFEISDYDDQRYTNQIKHTMKQRRLFAEKIEAEMSAKFYELRKIIRDMSTKNYDNIYEYKVNLYVYDLSATNVEKRKNPQGIKEPVKKGYDLEALKAAVDGRDNLVIEPVSSFELASFHNLEGKTQGLIFYKNLADSLIVNEQQGSIYFFMKENQNALCQETNNKLVRFTLKKLVYNQVQIMQQMDDGVSDNHTALSDLEELRNLKNQVLNFGENTKQLKSKRKYLENFYIQFTEKDIQNNYQIFCIPQQLSKFLKNQDDHQVNQKQANLINKVEHELLEREIVVVARFLNPNEISYEFRLLKNFKLLFKKRQKYQNSFLAINHGFENIKAFCEITEIDDTQNKNFSEQIIEISINVIDQQMINHYSLKFVQQRSDFSLHFFEQKHLISYENMLQGMEFKGSVIYDNDRYETYLISKGEQNSNFVVDITKDIRQKYTIQKLLTHESFKQMRSQSQLNIQSSQQIFLDHNMMMVDEYRQVEIDKEFQARNQQQQSIDKQFKQIEEMCKKNRLRKKFLQIDKGIIQHVLIKWLDKQTFLRAPHDIKKSKQKVKFESDQNIEEVAETDAKIFVNSIEISQNQDYIIANVHIIEYINEKAYCSHLSKDVLISILDLRSPTENQNPGYLMPFQKKPSKKTINPEERRSYESATTIYEANISDVEKKQALQVQQIVSMHNKFSVRQVNEFDIYQEDNLSNQNMDQRILQYLQKAVDIFEYVNNILILQFAENYQQNQQMIGSHRIVTHDENNLTIFEKQICIKNMYALFLLDEKYLVSVKQTLVSKARRQVMMDIRYFCLQSDEYTIDKPCFEVVAFSDDEEFYSQLKKYEKNKGLPDSRFYEQIQYIHGLFEEKNFMSIKISDQLYQQNNIYVAKIDHNKETLHLYTSSQTVMEIMKINEIGTFELKMELFQNIQLKSVSKQILDVQIMCQQRGKFIILFYKSGIIDFYEYMQNEQDYQQSFLIQSCRINFGIMNHSTYHTDCLHSNLKIIKYSKLLMSEDQLYVSEFFEQLDTNRTFHLYILMNDNEHYNAKNSHANKSNNIRYFEVTIDLNTLTNNISIAARGSKIMNFILTHENRFGIMYGSRDEPIHFEQNKITENIEVILGVRFSMIDFTKEIILNKAQQIFNKLHFRQHLNTNQMQNQFFTEREKKLISRQMHQVVGHMRKNIRFKHVLKYLIESQQANSKNKHTLLERSQRQEFLFGSLPHSVNLNDSEKVRLMLEEADKLPMADQKIIMNSIVNMKDLNQRSVFQKCLEQGHNLSFKVIFDQLMKIHGGIRTYDDQFAIKCLQAQLNEMAPFLLMNHEIFNFIINQQQFQFQIFARKLETDKTKVWLYEEQLAKYPNHEKPDLHELQLKDLKNWRKDGKMNEVMPEDYQSIFEALRRKLYKNGTRAQCSASCQRNKCFRRCYKKRSDANEGSEFSQSNAVPDAVSIYLCLDFNVVEYGYKMMHKIYEAQEYKDYQPKYAELVKQKEEDTIKRQRRAQKIQKCKDCIKSLRQESSKERKLRLQKEKEEQERREAEEEECSEDSVAEFDLEGWKPKSQIDEIALRIPPYIEQFSEKKVYDLLVFQIQDILVNCEDQIILNKKRFNVTTKLAFSKDIEGFVHHTWNQSAAWPQRTIQAINFCVFIVPFICDSYFATTYRLVYPIKRQTLREVDPELEFHLGITTAGLVTQFFFLALELVKLLASKRDKYQSLLEGPLINKSRKRITHVNISFFNILVAVLYISWGYSSYAMKYAVQEFENEVERGTKTKEEIWERASTLNLRTQVLQYVHLILMVLCFVMILEIVQSVSFNLFKQIQVLKNTFVAFSKYVLVFLLFNLLIGISFIWTIQRVETVRDWAQQIDITAADIKNKEILIPKSTAEKPATDGTESFDLKPYREWDRYSELQKTVKIFTGSLIHENLLSFRDHPDFFLTYAWLQQILDTVIHIFTIVFLMSIVTTCYRMQSSSSARIACHDQFDYAFLLKKNSENLEFQEVRNMFQEIRTCLAEWYKDPRSICAWIRGKLRGCRKFGQELGFETAKQVHQQATQNGKLLIISYKI